MGSAISNRFSFNSNYLCSMLILSNKKEKETLSITVDNNISKEIIVVTHKQVMTTETLDIIKEVKQKVTKKIKLNRYEYFKFINHLAGSINDYRKYLEAN